MTATAMPSAAVASQARRHWRIDALVLGVVAVLLRLPAFFATRSLVFDDGVYASSALAMRNGLQPFRDVFSSQGPVFLPLVWLADLLGLRTLDAPRLLTVASGVLLTIAVYSCARRVTTRGHALLAAGLVTTSGSVLWVTGPVNADGPSLALSVLAIALALRALDHATPHLADAVWVGLAAGAAASIKALSVPAIVVAGLVLLLTRRPRVGRGVGRRDRGRRVPGHRTALGPGSGARPVVHVPQRRPAAEHASRGRVEGRHHTVGARPPAVGRARAGAGHVPVHPDHPRIHWRASACRRTTACPASASWSAMLVLWAVLVFGLLVWEPALFRAHVAQIVPPLALLASLRPPPWTVLIVAAVVVAPFWVVRNDTILWPARVPRRRGGGGAAAAGAAG